MGEPARRSSATPHCVDGLPVEPLALKLGNRQRTSYGAQSVRYELLLFGQLVTVCQLSPTLIVSRQIAECAGVGRLFEGRSHAMAEWLFQMAVVQWMWWAADKADAGAMNSLGACFNNGHGVALDYQQAVEWYRRAADKDQVDAMFNLAVCCECGNSVANDFVEAHRLYERAATQGNQAAKKALERLAKSVHAQAAPSASATPTFTASRQPPATTTTHSHASPQPTNDAVSGGETAATSSAPAPAITTERRLPANPTEFTVDDVCIWLSRVGLCHLDATFRRHRVDGEILVELQPTDYKDIDVTAFGDRRGWKSSCPSYWLVQDLFQRPLLSQRQARSLLRRLRG